MATERKRKYKKNPESWGSIRKRASGRYQASYVGPDGERYTAPHTFDSLQDARAFNAMQRVAIQRGTWKSPAALAAEEEADAKRAESERFAAYAATWLLQRTNSKGQPLRPKTRAEYERQLQKGLAYFAEDRLTDITPARVRAWHAGRATKAPTAAGAEARLLRGILNTAVLDGILTSNPVEAKYGRTETGKEFRAPTVDELAIILEIIPARLRLAVLLAAYGSLRLGEWRALRRADLTITDGRAFVSISRAAQYVNRHGWVVGPPKSDEGVRVTPLPSWLTADVEAHLLEHVGPFPESLIFAPGGRTPFLTDRDWTRAWDVAREAAGVRGMVREHDLRHFAGTMHQRTGATIAETKRLLGHSTTAAAMAYQYATDERLTSLADLMPLLPVAPKRVARIGG